MTRSQSPITCITHTLPFDSLSPRNFERLCLWLVEREGYERAEHLGAEGSEHGPNDRAGIRHLVYRLDARYNACSKILRRCKANSGAMM
jgi:hypothetical protein